MRAADQSAQRAASQAPGSADPQLPVEVPGSADPQLPAESTPSYGQRVPFGLGVCLIFCAVPLIPRPTFAGAVLLAPAVALLLVAAAGLQTLHAHRTGRRTLLPGAGLAVLVAVVTLYAIRVVWGGQDSELSFVASRTLLVLLIGAAFVLFQHNDPERLWSWFVLGAAALTVLALVIGVTGLGWLEPARPPRVLGLEFPVHKTAGVPRSYGEQGIIVSVVMAYAVARWPRGGGGTRVSVAALGCAGLLLLLGQSRNMFLAALLVILATVLIAARKWVLLHLLWLSALLSTFVIGGLIPWLRTTQLGNALIGEGVFERNVQTRFAVMDHVWGFLGRDPVQGWLTGYTHQDWLDQGYGWDPDGPAFQETGLHNHFAADLAFHGILAGLLLILVMFAIPLWRIVERARTSGTLAQQDKFVLIAMVGTLSSLNFYEGFFSLTLALLVGHLWLRARSATLTPAATTRAAS